jgi:hypothetical protein
MHHSFAGHGNRKNCQVFEVMILLFAGMTYACLKAKITRL